MFDPILRTSGDVDNGTVGYPPTSTFTPRPRSSLAGRADGRSPFMNPRRSLLIRVALGVTLAGALVAVVSLVRMGDGLSILISGFTLWVLLPFAIGWGALRRRPWARFGAGGILVSSTFGLVMYFSLAFPLSRQSSTAGLAFIFLPLWQTALCACAIVFSLAADSRDQ
jgi:hypothetical protein